LGGLLENHELSVAINPPPVPLCTDGGGGTTAVPTPLVEAPRPLPPLSPAPCIEGGGGTTATPGPEMAPALPECSIDGGGGTTAPPGVSPRGPAPRNPCDANDGGGATTEALPAPRLPGVREAPASDGGGATTLADPGLRSVWSLATPRASTGGATMPACSDPTSPLVRPVTSGGGATAEFSPFNGALLRAVAESGTDGMVGSAARFGARGPSANFRSGGTTNFGVPRFSAATGMAFARAAEAVLVPFA